MYTAIANYRKNTLYRIRALRSFRSLKKLNP